MQVSVNVHGPQVQSVRVLSPEVTVVDVGERGAGMGMEQVRLFVAPDDLLSLVVDLVNDADGVLPGFLLRVLDGLTGWSNAGSSRQNSRSPAYYPLTKPLV